RSSWARRRQPHRQLKPSRNSTHCAGESRNWRPGWKNPREENEPCVGSKRERYNSQGQASVRSCDVPKMPDKNRMRLQSKRKKATGSSKAGSRKHIHRVDLEADISPWTEMLFAAEILLLHATPVYYGFGIPRGDGSAVVIIPGFLGTDLYLMELHAWLGRIGYQPYFSGIGINADCPNLLIQRHVSETVQRALAETGRRIHLIGHSLGGIIAR